MKTIRNLNPAWIAGIIAVTVALWVFSGMVGGKPEAANTAQNTDKPKNEKLVKVEVAMSQGELITREAIVNSRTAPVRSVRIRAETSGRISEVITKRGAFIKKGGIIVRLAPNERNAQLRQAKAVLKQRQLQFEAAQRLREGDYMTEVELAQSKANLEIAQADVERIQQDLNHTVIRAPFAGVLETRNVEVGDYVKVGDEIGYIIEQDPFIVRGSVSEDVIGYLEVGQPGTVDLINNETREGVVRYVAGEADPQTRTYAVELLVANPGGRLIAGTSALMHLPLENVLAHQLEPATLTLNVDGKFGIKTVDKNGRVRFYEANIVRNNNDMIWLSGLPENLQVITIGQDFVSEGDRVEVITKDSPEPASDEVTPDEMMIEGSPA